MILLIKQTINSTLLHYRYQSHFTLQLSASKEFSTRDQQVQHATRLSRGHYEDYPTKSSCLALSATTQIPINLLKSVRNMVFLNFYFGRYNTHSFFELSLFLILSDLNPLPHSFHLFSYCPTIVETQKCVLLIP